MSKVKPSMEVFYSAIEANRVLLSTCEGCDEILSKPDPVLMMAEESAESGDVEGILGLLDNTYRLAFVADNIQWLKSQNKYEYALLDAYTSTRTNYSGFSLSTIKNLFEIADRAALLAEGEPLPGVGPFTVYRGVAGNGAQRRLRGLSWTADKEKAIWFAERYHKHGVSDPAVFQAEIPAALVYAYDNGREEQEFICDIKKDHKLLRVWPDKDTLTRKTKGCKG